MPTESIVANSTTALPSAAQDASAARHLRWRLVAFASAIAALAAVTSIWAFRQAGSWLVIQDSLAPAHAIVVLSGGMPYRAREAARIYEQNLAAQVWVSQPISPRTELGKLGIAYLDESFYSQRVLLASAVPS